MTNQHFQITRIERDWNKDGADPVVGDLAGLVFKHVVQMGSDELAFLAADGTGFLFYHSQDCCESVDIESVVGELSDLAGEPILTAEEVTGETAEPTGWKPGEYEESFTWTFYKFATRKGYVDVRWFGSSNGYYSESVDICRVTWSD